MKAPLATLGVSLALIAGNAIPGWTATRAEVEKTIALMINLNGYLCAKVTTVNPLQLENTYEVRCIEYGGGTGTVDYIVAIRSDGVIVEKR